MRFATQKVDCKNVGINPQRSCMHLISEISKKGFFRKMKFECRISF